MKLPSARSSRASIPFSTTNRDPDSFDAVSKSISPSRSPISKCCNGWLMPASLGGSPTLRTSLLSCSSLPSGTSSSGRFGMTERASCSALSAAFWSVSPLSSASFRSATSAIRARALSSSFFALAWPISLEAALRRAW